jgi:hypothetical protein
MTEEQFKKQKWGAGMIAKYKDESTELTSDVISVDFETCEIGLEVPLSGDLVFFPCEQCEIIKDFIPKP